jgi:hypothetical protein
MNYAEETISERIVRQLPPLKDEKRALEILEECEQCQRRKHPRSTPENT